MVQFLWKELKLDIHQKDIQHEGCLHWVCRGGDSNLPLLQYLVEEVQIDVNDENINQETPVFLCVKTSCDYDQFQNIQYLADHQAKIDLKNQDGESLISIAKSYENNDLIKLLKIRQFGHN